ncbi:MAG: hypothetical protein B7Z67_09055 [Acidiphilium sp. 21-60-14]|nr:MAG: hypothetical protein B7Z67_09055 [Acidiphilium sp. 21-60-14]OZB39419.1 MAG: hypothetical protein B7X48_08895 [Acidiphilium sp. 34-60-192]
MRMIDRFVTGLPRWRGVLLGLFAVIICVTSQGSAMANNIYFQGSDVALQLAVDADSPPAIAAALAHGASVNAREREVGGTILEYAVAQFRNRAVEALLKAGADPNLRDRDGDNAVTLAVRAFSRDPQLLQMVLAHGGDANTFSPRGSYVIEHFLADRDFAGLELLVKYGADLNVRGASAQPPDQGGNWMAGRPFGGWDMKGGSPAILYAAEAVDWDVVLKMLQLGAKFDYPDEPVTFPDLFKGKAGAFPPPDSWGYYYKLKCYDFMKAHGLKLPPFGPGAGGADGAPANWTPPPGPDPAAHEFLANPKAG